VVLSALAAVWLCGVAAAGTEGTPNAALAFRVFANTGHHLDAILWTGRQFLYVENTANTIWAAHGAGVPLHRFAGMPRLVEETRCVISPGTNGYPPNVIFCHSPDDKIYEISAGGSQVTVFATLPVPASTTSDGALALDTVGRFGHQLVAATGRSGAKQPLGGAVYTIGAAGAVKEVGSYSGPGADEVVIAPSGFGSAAGEALLSLDGGADTGALVAMDASGRTRTLANLPGGLNPIEPIPATVTPTASPPAGIYVTNDIGPYLYFAPASELRPFRGDIVVGSENTARFWIVEPKGDGYLALPVGRILGGHTFSLEGSTFVG
jgi:hypothetical protein